MTYKRTSQVQILDSFLGLICLWPRTSPAGELKVPPVSSVLWALFSIAWNPTVAPLASKCIYLLLEIIHNCNMISDFHFRKKKKTRCVCVCVHAQVICVVYVLVSVFACVWWQRMILGTLSTAFHLWRLGVSSVWLGWLTNDCQGSACIHLLPTPPPGTGVADAPLRTPSF